MKKIMLVIDDFNELVATEAVLRRLGFDVLSLGKDLLVNDALFKFHPDVAVVSHKGRMVDGLKLAPRLKKTSPAPLIVLAHAHGLASQVTLQFTNENRASIDALIESPILPQTLIPILAQLTGTDGAALLDRYEKMMSPRAGDSQTKSGQKAASPTRLGDLDPKHMHLSWDPKQTPGMAAHAKSERSDRYAKFLRDHARDVEATDAVDTMMTVPREKLEAAMAKLKVDSEGERGELESINQSKREFAKTLFTSGQKTSNKK